MRPPKYIVWHMRKDLDISNLEMRKWWIKQVLMKGRMEDIQQLDSAEIERLLPDLYLPKPIKTLWSNYFARKKILTPFQENILNAPKYPE